MNIQRRRSLEAAGNDLRRIRRALRLTQAAFGAELGIHPHILSRYERGTRYNETVMKLAAVLWENVLENSKDGLEGRLGVPAVVLVSNHARHQGFEMRIDSELLLVKVF